MSKTKIEIKRRSTLNLNTNLIKNSSIDKIINRNVDEELIIIDDQDLNIYTNILMRFKFVNSEYVEIDYKLLETLKYFFYDLKNIDGVKNYYNDIFEILEGWEREYESEIHNITVNLKRNIF